MINHSSNNEVITSSQRSAGAGVSNYIPAKTYRFAILTVYITGKSGAPTLDLALQCSPVNPVVDNNKWRNVYSEAKLTNIMIGSPSAGSPSIFGGNLQENFSGWLRIAYTVGGSSTPKVTFSLNLELKNGG